jgi:hypothetical protein
MHFRKPGCLAAVAVKGVAFIAYVVARSGAKMLICETYTPEKINCQHKKNGPFSGRITY